MSTVPTYRGPLLTLVRHGETEANVAHVLQGQTDSPLTARGQAQVLALGRQWRRVNRPQGGESTSPATGPSLCSNGLPVPNAIVASPTGRARKTGSAIFLGTQYVPGTSEDAAFNDDGEHSSSIPSTSLTASSAREVSESPPPPPSLILDPLLMEQDFGSLEGTRKRVRVPGFPPPSPSMRGESRDMLAKRVRQAGQLWLDAVGMGDAVNRFGQPVRSKATASAASTTATRATDEAAMKKATEEADRLAEAMQGGLEEEDDDGRAEDPRQAKRQRLEPPRRKTTTESSSTAPRDPEGTSLSDSTVAAHRHLVLVSHGLWISTFLNYFQPAMDKSSSTASSYPFATNTGSFTFGIRPVNRLPTTFSKSAKGIDGTEQQSGDVRRGDEKMTHELFLLRINDTAHLARLGSLSKGSPKKETGLQNIASFFTKKS